MRPDRIFYHFTSYHHVMEIIASGKIKRTSSNLLEPINLRIENGVAVSDTDYYKPVVWLTSKPTHSKIGVFFPELAVHPEHDKRRIRIDIPDAQELDIVPWSIWAKENGIAPKWRETLTRGMNYSAWYVTEKEIPVSAISHIIDLQEKIEIVGFKGAIDHQISQDRDKGPSEALQGPPGGEGISLHPEALQTAQNAVQKAGETVSQFVERAVEAQAQRDEIGRKMKGGKASE